MAFCSGRHEVRWPGNLREEKPKAGSIFPRDPIGKVELIEEFCNPEAGMNPHDKSKSDESGYLRLRRLASRPK
jgi:hypothetical protein